MEPDRFGGDGTGGNQRFNPRARVEPDLAFYADRQLEEVSIHGLAWSPTRNPLDVP